MKNFVKLARNEMKMIRGGERIPADGYSFDPATASCMSNSTGAYVAMIFCFNNTGPIVNCGSGSVARCIYDDNANLIAAVPQSCQQFCPN